MEILGFSKEEVSLYKLRKELDQETDQEVRRIIQEFKKILPPEYHISKDNGRYSTGVSIANTGALINAVLLNDPKVFHRNKETPVSNNPKLFKLAAIDRSGSMGSFSDLDSPFRQAVKSAIIEAKVREHFDVDFCLLIYDDVLDEVISFGEKFKSR